MYLSHIHIDNFRKIKLLDLRFNTGINLLVGENDSGKSSIIDAIKAVTGTLSNDWFRFNIDDFHTNKTSRANELKIICLFDGLSQEEVAAFLEWISFDETRFYLKITLTARLRAGANSSTEIFYDIKAGEDEESGTLSGEARNKLRVTYLKALRDADHELAPRKGSRLSQILGAHDVFKQHPGVIHPLVGSMDKANLEITDFFENKEGSSISDTINATYLKSMSLAKNPISSKFGIGRNELGRILEKLELLGFSTGTDTNLGLGSSNLLFIAAEMLLLKKEANYLGLKLLLIEEMEAHIHPQSQINLIDFLNKHCEELGFQTIITTHSNSLTSKADLNNIIICKDGNAFSLHHSQTKLEKADYNFLRRFLDDTKANLFFANGLLLVEGDAENLILPAFAEYIGFPLHKYGISIVNVGSTALLRYAKIFQRKDNQNIGIKVSCVSDRDIPPKEAKEYIYEVKKRDGNIEERCLISDSRKTEDEYSEDEIQKIILNKEEKFKGGDVDVFLGSTWTLEFEIAKSCLRELLHCSIQIAIKLNNESKDFILSDYKNVLRKCNGDFIQWAIDKKSENEIAVAIYAPLERKQASKAISAQVFSMLLRRTSEKKTKIDATKVLTDPALSYLVMAIKHAAHV